MKQSVTPMIYLGIELAVKTRKKRNITVTYLEPSQRSMMEVFNEIVDS